MGGEGSYGCRETVATRMSLHRAGMRRDPWNIPHELGYGESRDRERGLGVQK